MSNAHVSRVRARLSPALSCALLSALLLAGCESTPSSHVALRIDELPVSTIIATRRPDGSTVEQQGGDPELVGRKVVALQIGVFEPTTIESIALTYWAAGNRAGARTFERALNEQYNAEPGPTAVIHKLEIPGADKFVQCMGLYYMFSAKYRLADGKPATFNGPPHLIQPSKRLLPDGTVEQASCGPPPGPNE